MNTPKYAVGDWICETPYDPQYDDIYQIKDVAASKSGGWCYSLDGHPSNGGSAFNATGDYYFEESAISDAPQWAVRDVVSEQTKQQILTRLSALDIVSLIPDDLTPDQITQMAPCLREIAILSGLSAGVLRGAKKYNFPVDASA